MTRTIDTRTPAAIAYDNLKTGATYVKDIPITADEQEVIYQIRLRPARRFRARATLGAGPCGRQQSHGTPRP